MHNFQSEKNTVEASLNSFACKQLLPGLVVIVKLKL